MGFFNTVEVKDTCYAYLVNLSSSLPHTWMDIPISPLITVTDSSGRHDKSVKLFSIQLLNPLISGGIKCLAGNHCFPFSICSTASLYLQKLLKYSSVSKKREKDTQRVPSLSPRAESRTARILSTTFYSSNASNKHCSYKCLMCLVNLSTQ